MTEEQIEAMEERLHQALISFDRTVAANINHRSYWLRLRFQEMREMEPTDALSDAETLLEIAQERLALIQEVCGK